MELDFDKGKGVRNSILIPFVNETIMALESMADLKGTSSLLSHYHPLDVFKFKGFAVCVVAKTYGAIEGKIIMNHNLETALAIGNKVRAKMLGTTEESTVLNSEIGEALAEFSNTAIGLATRHFNDSDYKITFSPPLHITNPEDSAFLLEGVVEIYTVPIEIENVGRFYFSYLLHHKSG